MRCDHITGLRDLARQALDRVMTEPSELLELWSESDGVPWRAVIRRLPDGVSSMHELPADCTSAPLGRQSDVLVTVKQAVPEVDLSDPTWGELSGLTWSIELNIGSEDPVDSIMLHIRGSGDDALRPVFRLGEALRCKVLDLAEGDLIAPGQALGWCAFQPFRDRVV